MNTISNIIKSMSTIFIQGLNKKYKLNSVTRLLSLISESDKSLRPRLWSFLMINVISSFIELFTLASVPLLIISLSAANNPTMIYLQENAPGGKIFIYVLPFIIIGGSICSYIVRTYIMKSILQVAAVVGTDLSQIAYSNVINYDLSRIKSQPTSDLIAKFSYFDLLITTCITPLLTAASSLLTVGIFLIVFCFYKPVITLAIWVTFAALYAAQSKKNSSIVLNASTKIGNLNILHKDLVSQAVESNADLKIYGIDKYALEQFGKTDSQIRHLVNLCMFTSIYPKYKYETLGLIIIALIAFGALIKGRPEEGLAYVTFFAVASQRILPAIQQMYLAYNSIKSHDYVVRSVMELIKGPHSDNKSTIEKIHSQNSPKTFYKNSSTNKIAISSYNSTFAPPRSNKNIFYPSFEFGNGDIVGVIGSSGSGKTTLIEAICGLRSDLTGKINFLVNNQNLEGHERFQHIAYASQRSTILRTSILSNVTCQPNINSVNMNSFNYSLEKAGILDLVNSLEFGFKTELITSSTLSGGQLQRILIARVIYKVITSHCPLIVLDEFTSALDHDTEAFILESLKSIIANKLTLIITHRYAPLSICTQHYKIS